MASWTGNSGNTGWITLGELRAALEAPDTNARLLELRVLEAARHHMTIARDLLSTYKGYASDTPKPARSGRQRES